MLGSKSTSTDLNIPKPHSRVRLFDAKTGGAKEGTCSSLFVDNFSIRDK